MEKELSEDDWEKLEFLLERLWTEVPEEFSLKQRSAAKRIQQELSDQ